jgi:hypothetical protein
LGDEGLPDVAGAGAPFCSAQAPQVAGVADSRVVAIEMARAGGDALTDAVVSSVAFVAGCRAGSACAGSTNCLCAALAETSPSPATPSGCAAKPQRATIRTEP